MRYFLLQLEVTGKRPVWSVEILPVTSMDFNNVILVRTRGSVMGIEGVVISGVLLSMEGVAVILVERTFRHCWRRFPWAVQLPWGHVYGQAER